MEAAVTDQALGLQVAPEKQGFVGYGSAQLTEDTLAAALAGRTFIAGDRFSAAALYLCATLAFALATWMATGYAATLAGALALCPWIVGDEFASEWTPCSRGRINQNI